MPTKRSDKAKNVDKVAAAIVKNPLGSEREIAKMAGVSNATVNRIKEEVKQTVAKDDRVKSLTGKDAQIQSLIATLKLKKLDKAIQLAEEGQKLNISDSDLNSWDKHSAERHMKLVGDATDEKGGMKQIEGINYIVPEKPKEE